MYDRIIFELLRPEDVHIVTFGTCGVTPRELDTEYPFMNYEFMMGRCNVAKIKRIYKMESERLARYLEKTRDNYKHRIAYCIGDFRTAMQKATEMVDINVEIVPAENTLSENLQPEKRFIYGSLSRKPYLQDLSDTLSRIMGIPKRNVGIDENLSVNDTDWYLL